MKQTNENRWDGFSAKELDILSLSLVEYMRREEEDCTDDELFIEIEDELIKREVECND